MSDTLGTKLERRAASVLFGLPAGVQRLLCGGRATRVDGQTLCAEMQLMLMAQRLRRGTVALAAESVEAARANMRRDVLAVQGPEVPVASVRDLDLDGTTAKLRARLYVPSGSESPRPLLVFLHGGGFALGDLDTHDEPCRRLCRDAQINVLAVAYRLAPEHPFPAALEDAVSSLHWAQQHAAALGADPTRVAIGGDSAGATLSTVATQLAIRSGGVAPCLQLLIYPETDRAIQRPSFELFGAGFYLTRADMSWFDGHYLGPARQYADPLVSPLLAGSLAGLCPTLLITAGFDSLRDEGEAYANALLTAGNRVETWREPELLHGFINMVGFSRTARRALGRVSHALQRMLDQPSLSASAGSMLAAEQAAL